MFLLLRFHFRLFCWAMKHFVIIFIISQTMQKVWIVKAKKKDISIYLQIDIYESGRSETCIEFQGGPWLLLDRLQRFKKCVGNCGVVERFFVWGTAWRIVCLWQAHSFISIQPQRPGWQEPGPSHVTCMVLAHSILGKFLGVVWHCFPPPLDVPTFAPRCLYFRNDARDPSSERWKSGWEIFR